MEKPPKKIKIEDEFIPRDYQLELLKEVEKNNTVLYLPTGSGKTYIATMLIKSMGHSLNKPVNNGRKRTFFLVNTVPLVLQQASFLRKHLPWNIGTFSGDMNLDFWSQDQWDKIIDDCHIMVMTAQIYLNNLHHGYMKINDANLLIFDECHHAKANHPFRQIMQVYHDDSKKENRPRILGLTATLINSNCKNIKNELATLQLTFNATIQTRYNENIKLFSTKPDSQVCLYDKFTLNTEQMFISERLNSFAEKLKRILTTPNNEPIVEDKEIFHMENLKQATKNLANFFLDIDVNYLDSGTYIGFLATWHYIIEIEKKKKLSEDGDKFIIFSLVLSELVIIRKLFSDYIKKHSKSTEGSLALIENSSPKLLKLISFLKNVKRDDSCLIFVDRRSTAKLLYHFIKELKLRNFNFKNVECDFIVGARGLAFSPLSNEAMYLKKQNQNIVKSFHKNDINVLITSEVLEEGIDIPECNYVIRYDLPKNFPSYIQSKGRARSKNSKFIVMTQNYVECQQTQNVYTSMEKEIEKILVSECIDDSSNDDEQSGENFQTELATLTHEMAIGIINRYCNSLPQDLFSVLSPEWWLAETQNNLKKYKLKLPINSAIKTSIDGKFCYSKKNAKKSSAFNACIQLYHAGALDENLLPTSVKNKLVYNDVNWFPHWVENDNEAKDCKPGTNKMRRIVNIHSPSYLDGVYPISNETLYLHMIETVPTYEKLDDKKYEKFDMLIRSNEKFAILTSNKLPPVSQFPIFLNFGHFNVSIKVNTKTIILDQEQKGKLEQFHNKLFVDVLGVKDFVVRSYKNGKNSYLIVPIIASGNKCSIDWKVIDINIFVETNPPTLDQRKAKFYEKYFNTPYIISPWYRNITPIQMYLVSEVHKDMSPESIFPSDNYDTYKDYFQDKYSIKVTNPDQPLIQVKSLGVQKINYIVPRIHNGKVDKRNEFIEILIPEFCMWHQFPSVYWLKALMLPTILYRFNQLLLAEDLLEKINKICGFNFTKKNNYSESLKVDKFYGSRNMEKKKVETILPLCETMKLLKNSLNEVNDWKLKDLPIDIERQKNTTALDIINYISFMNPKKKLNEKSTMDEIKTIMKTVLSKINLLNFAKNKAPILESLSKCISNYTVGPRQCDILKAITPSCTSDIFNYECMETFGDSFLKFATSLVLFDSFEKENEGVLTDLKMKLVGNRNLFYIGRNINLGSYITVNTFEPSMDWVPPCFSVPEKLVSDINIFDQVPSDVLYQIVIPRDDKLSGELSENTWSHIENECVRFKELYDTEVSPKFGYSQSDIFLNKQSISDKMVADSVEALIGTYVYHCGLEGGFKILSGFGIIPSEFVNVYKPKVVLKNTVDDMNMSQLVPGYELLEKRIGYEFKCKHLLLMALTHPTHVLGFSECYQRLEFLGDAILDFLITSYIIEHCTNKSPGEITDIRSSLVNNITFASLSARIGLHRFLLSESIKLTEAIDRFYEHQEKNHHQVGQEVLYLLEEKDCMVAEAIDVPKVLGDLFESLIAAIYLDCGRDLKFVWQFCYKLMEQEIKEFSTNIPKNPIRILHETNVQPSFSKPPTSQIASDHRLGTMIQLEIFVDSQKLTMFGLGKNKKEAKLAAAKMALKRIRNVL
ncbi:endoribonuclease Dicer-like isoform X2 [Daktulosphaira vitifoliae]|uniref:endoribonuclease Dicer-like isoform X2 n=1 Tax=Daktulosphaira vitifoliae TaxID=58002 RepID=UPI0021A9820D|nr:endoribonuclease Dicer-like isoform X2 [Daktulosphaira vitifoliae]